MTPGSDLPADGLRPAVLACLTVVAAVVGGLAAASLVHTSIPATIGISVIVGGLTEFGMRWWSGRATQQDIAPHMHDEARNRQLTTWPSNASRTQYGASLSDPPISPMPTAGRVAQGAEPSRSAAIVQVLPIAPGPQGSAVPWWTAAQQSPPPPQSVDDLADPPDLSTYLHSAVIAQCPRCGAFDLDIKSSDVAIWGISCLSCSHAWEWEPGSPWPPIRVMPRARRPPPPEEMPRRKNGLGWEG